MRTDFEILYMTDLQDIGLKLEKELLVTASGPVEYSTKAANLNEHRQSPTSNSMYVYLDLSLAMP